MGVFNNNEVALRKGSKYICPVLSVYMHLYMYTCTLVHVHVFRHSYVIRILRGCMACIYLKNKWNLILVSRLTTGYSLPLFSYHILPNVIGRRWVVCHVGDCFICIFTDLMWLYLPSLAYTGEIKEIQGETEERSMEKKTHWDSPDAIIKSLIASGHSQKV